MAKLQLQKLIPSSWEVGGLALASLAIALLGNLTHLIHRYQLDNSVQTIGNRADTTLTTGLSKIDSYQATPTIVTFLVWAVIGLFTLSVLQAILRITGEIKYNNQLTSNAYVHPTNFSRRGFWHQVVLHSLGTFVTVTLLGVAITLFALYVLPLGLIYIRVFLLDFSLANSLYALLGLAVLWVGLLIVDVFARLVRWRYRLVKH